METVVIIIMAAVSFSFILKLTFHRSLGAFVLALIAAASVILTYDEAASQSKTQIADWLQNPELMLDTSVWLTIDVAFQLCFCSLYALKMCGKLSLKEKTALLVCQWFPGLLIFPVLFAFLTQLIFSMPGSDFAVIGWSLAGAIFIMLPLLALLFKWLLPEGEIRLELLFMINLLIAALGIVATVNGRTAAVGTNSVGWDALTAVFCLLLLGCVAGYFLNRLITDKKITKIQNL